MGLVLLILLAIFIFIFVFMIVMGMLGIVVGSYEMILEFFLSRSLTDIEFVVSSAVDGDKSFFWGVSFAFPMGVGASYFSGILLRRKKRMRILKQVLEEM